MRFGLIGLLYVYFTFFLGPLNNSRNSIQGKINELEQKIATSKAEISKATKLERELRMPLPSAMMPCARLAPMVHRSHSYPRE